MVKKYLIFALLTISCMSSIFALNTIECDFKTSCINPGERPFFYANKYFYDDYGEVLSSNVDVSGDINYNETLCCKSMYGIIDVKIKNSQTEVCDPSAVDVMYFTNWTNARVGFSKYESEFITYFNDTFYSRKLCVNIPDAFSSFDIIVSEENFSIVGYSCMYKINLLENGQVSSCDAVYNGSEQYLYTVWGRMWQHTQSLNCNADCTSKLDNRVYTGCGSLISECEHVPVECNGALLGSWIIHNDTTEVECSAPWDNYRNRLFTETNLNIEIVDDEDNNCANVIKTKYNVMIDNEVTNMNVYVCND